MLIQPTRRGFLRALGFVAAAPAIIKVSALMPVRPVEPPPIITAMDVADGGVMMRGRVMTTAQFRALLQPGMNALFCEMYTQRDYPDAWREIFANA